MAADDALADLSSVLSGGHLPQVTTPQALTGVNAILSDLQKTPEQLHAENAAAQRSAGIAANVGAGVNEFIAGAAGAPVDAATWLINRGYGALTGRDQPLISNPVGGSESLKSAMGLIGADPRNIAAIETADRVARATGEGIGGMVAPYMGARAAIVRGVEGLPGAVARMIGGPAPASSGLVGTTAGALSNAAVGAGAGVGGEAAKALTPEGSPYAPLTNFAGQMLGGGLVAGGMGAGRAALNTTGQFARNQIAPITEAGREGIVGRRLLGAAENPQTAMETLGVDPEILAGSRPTAYQLSGDQGIGQLERGQRTVSPAPFLERMGEQNAARVGAIEALAPENAAPTSVRDLLRQRLDQVSQEGDSYVNAARANAQQAYEMAGGQMTREDMGALMRDQLEAAKAAAKQQESGLWQAIDPDKTLSINATQVREIANKLISEIPKTARQQEGEEKAVFGFARLAGDAMPFQDFAALRGRLLQAIRDERENGQTPALRRMQQLRSEMDNAIYNAAEIASQKTQAGMPDLATRLTSEANAWRETRDRQFQSEADTGTGGGGSGPGVGQVPRAGGTVAVPGPFGAIGAEGSGPVYGSGLSGISRTASPVANFDEAAAARYRVAADATRQRAETYNNQIVGPTLQERGNDYRMLGSQVPERFISSPEGVAAFIAAGGLPSTMRDALVMDLRRSATSPDGALDVGRYQAWLNRRADAIRAFPDLEQRLSNVAHAQESVDVAAAEARGRLQEFQRGAARHFLNAEPTQAVQSVLRGKNPVGDMSELAAQVASNADAKEGLRRAVADYMKQELIGNTEVGTSGVSGLKADAFQNFVKRNQVALSPIFSPNELLSLQQVAADLTRANRSIVGSKIPGGSDTAQNLHATGAVGTGQSVMGQFVLHGLSGLIGYLTGGGSVATAASAAGGSVAIKEAVSLLQRPGLKLADELMTKALLDPEFAQILMIRATNANRPIVAQRLLPQLLTLAGNSAAAGEERQPKTQPIGARVPPAVMPPPSPQLVPGGALRQ